LRPLEEKKAELEKIVEASYKELAEDYLFRKYLAEKQEKA